jgi:hypothetical protein
MTSRQREDLYIKWSFFGPYRQDILKRQYYRRYGMARDKHHWERFLASKLGLFKYWEENDIY